MIDDAIDSVEPDSPAVRRLWRFALTCLVAVLALACSNPSGANDPAAALREAAGRGDTPAVRALLEQGVPVDARDDQGATALVQPPTATTSTSRPCSCRPGPTSTSRTTPGRAPT